jgi:osmotically-inducible protein OsmY
MAAAAGRNDTKIKNDVIRQLQSEAEVPETQLNVSIRDGVCVLEGTVQWPHQSEAAELCAKRVVGVQSVDNRIRVLPGAGERESW